MQPQQEIQIAENRIPYWSRFTVNYDLRYDGTNSERTIFTKGSKIVLFNYRRGESNVTALDGGLATDRDTILVQANQTRGGALYKIHGITLAKDSTPYEVLDSDGKRTTHKLPMFTSAAGANGATPQISVEDGRGLEAFSYAVFQKYFNLTLNIDGTKRIIEWGPSINYPGVSGPVGGNVATTNGVLVGNHIHFIDGINWNPAGTSDSNMEVALEAAYDCVVDTFTAPDGNAPDGTPITDAIPTTIGRDWTQGWIMRLEGVEISPTSQVS